MKRPFLISILFCLLGKLSYAQCTVYERCSNTDYNYGANCHGFSLRYLTKAYALGGIACGTPTEAENEIIYDCVNKNGAIFWSSFVGYLQSAGDDDHTVILYRNAAGEVRHSAVKLSSNRYMSKFESSGGVRIHQMTSEVPLIYYNPAIGDYITKHKLNPTYLNTGDPMVSYWPSGLSQSACTSCSCKTSQGWFLVSVNAPTGSGVGSRSWGPFTWNVSAASIAYNANTYIYVNKPGGGSVGVTTSSRFTYRTNCYRDYSKFSFFNFPSCTSGGFYSYTMPRMSVDIAQDGRNVTFVLPETLTKFIDDIKETRADLQVLVYDLNGRVYESAFINSDMPSVELREPLTKGVYIFKVVVDDTTSMTEKISIQD